MEDRVREVLNKVSTLKNMHRMEEKKLQTLINERTELESTVRVLEGVQDLFKRLTQTLIDQEIKPLQDFVTFGLKKVFFDRDLEFTVFRKETAKGQDYSFLLKDGDIEAPLKDSFGGSILEVISLMLRICVIKRLEKRCFICFDEFFTGISSKYRGNLSSLLSVICEKSEFDIFMITHEEGFTEVADNVLYAHRTKNGFKIKEREREKQTRSGSEAPQVQEATP